MYTGFYTFKLFARDIKATIKEFPISFWETPAGHHGVKQFHEHEFLEMVLITAGTAVHIVDGRKATVREGDVLLIYPHARHGYDECGTMGLIDIMYDHTKLPFPILDGDRIQLYRRFFPPDLDHIGFPNSPEPVLHFDSREDLERVAEDARMLGRELTTQQPGNMATSIVLLMSIILKTLRLSTGLLEDSREKRVFPFGKVLEYLNKNFTRRISVEELARMSIYSQSAFQRKFKNYTGYCVTEYLLRKRIALAQKLLREETERSVGECGFECGFLDANYFSRSFRKITGLTPREYRASLSAPLDNGLSSPTALSASGDDSVE